MVFLVSLFFLRIISKDKNQENQQISQDAGLTYGNEIIGSLVNKDTDLDGVLDWEEGLWGTDLAKKDTNEDGVPDNVEIENLKKQAGQGELEGFSFEQNNENLTETDKFSREFFATVATLNQTGQMDQATMEQLGSALSERIQNSTPRKIFLLSDLKIAANDDTQAIQDYSETFSNIYETNPINYTVIDVLQKFIIDENNVDVSALDELNHIINQTNKIIDGMAKISVPQSLISLHLDFINALERLSENISDIKLYDTDVIVSLSGISQYGRNTAMLQSAISNLAEAINRKLSN